MGRDIEAEVRRVVGEQLHVPEETITLAASFTKDLGADSLALVELTLTLEERFDIDISDEDAEGMRTVQDVVDFIHQHNAERNFDRSSLGS
jgi:acyl carrier protein